MHVCHVNILNFQKYKMLETVLISTLQFNIVLNFIFVFKLIVRKIKYGIKVVSKYQWCCQLKQDNID